MSDDLVTIEVNGVEMQARKGAMLIEATDLAGIYVPRFCYHHKLSIAANCRMCLVEVEKAPKPLPACATPIADGMKVFTRSEDAIAAQKATMEFLLINHPLDCPICDQGGECELQDLAMGFGRGISRYTERKRVVADKDIGPLISTDMTRCIHCTRCVRFGEEISGKQELGALGRSENMEIGTYVERSVNHELSGNVIDLCPVGALNSRPFRFRARSWEMLQQATVSPHDAFGTNLYAHVLAGKVLRVVPRPNEDINETWIADRDRFSYEGIYSIDRLPRPLVRGDDGLHETDWATALRRAADGLSAARGEALGVLGGPMTTLEEAFLLQGLARALGSNNLDHRLRTTDFRGQADDPPYPWLGGSIPEIEACDALLILGSRLRHEMPMLAHRVRKAALRGGKVMLAGSPGEYLFNVFAEDSAPPAALVRVLARLVGAAEVASGRAAPDAIASLVDRGPHGDSHRVMTAALVEGERARIVLGAQAQHHPDWSLIRTLATTLANLTGAQIGYLPHSAGAVGAALAGLLPHRGPGARPLAHSGLDAGQMLAQPREAYLLFGVEPALDCRNGEEALTALSDAFVVSASPWLDARAAEYADVVLPIGTFAETGGTYVNMEGRWQSFSGVARPVLEARPGWKVLRVLANALGLPGFDQDSVEEVRVAAHAAIGDITPDNSLNIHTLTEPVDPATVPDLGVPLYAGDALVRRSAPLQLTGDARTAVR